MHLTDAQIIAGLKSCKKLDVYSLTDHQIAMVFRKAVEMSETPADPWKDAVLQACMMTESGFVEADPGLSVRNLIQWHTQLATDVAAHPAHQAESVAFQHLRESVAKQMAGVNEALGKAATQASDAKSVQWEDGAPPIGSYGVDVAASGDAEREALTGFTVQEVIDACDAAGIDDREFRRLMSALKVKAQATTEFYVEMDQALSERDEREEVINAILDEVLGLDRHEWSSAYGFADAIEDVKTRMWALTRPPAPEEAKDATTTAHEPGESIPPTQPRKRPWWHSPGY